MTNLEVQSLKGSEGVQDMFRGLVRLDQCLAEFRRRGGDPIIGRLYGTRYDAFALVLYAINSMGLFPHGVFDFRADSMERLGLSDVAPEVSGAVERYRTEAVTDEEDQDGRESPPP